MKRKDHNPQMKQMNVGFKAEAVRDDGTFKGYASVFGNVDLGGDIVAPGAFDASLKEYRKSGDPVPVLWQHDSRTPIGGDQNLLEDSKGLLADGFLLIDEIPQAKQAHSLMKRRVVKGLSIGYFVEADSYNEKTGITTLQKLALREYSIVTFPMNTLANVEEVKNIIQGGRLPSLPEFENILREVGFTNSQSKAIAGHGLRKLLDQCEADGHASECMSIIKGFKLPEIKFQ